MTLNQARVLVTREKTQGRVFSEKLRAHDGIPIEAPLLQISRKPSAENERCMRQLSDYEWIFFTSANGVKYFYELISVYQIPACVLGDVRFAVVGRKTEKALLEYGGRRADFIPTVYDADHMAEQFLNRFKIGGKVLLVRGNLSRSVLPELLGENSVAYDAVEVYETITAVHSKELLNDILKHSRIDFLSFTSPSAVTAYEQLAEKSLRDNTTVTCVCIGDTTKHKALAAGFKNVLVPSEYTIEGMIACMENYLEKRNDM